MAITRINSQDTIASASASSVTAVYAQSTISGDLLVAITMSNGSTTTLNAGWTKLVNNHMLNSGSTDNNCIFYKIADGSERMVTATTAGANISVIDLFEYTGVSSLAFLDGTASGQSVNSSVVTYTTPSIVTTQKGDLILSVLVTLSAISSFSWQKSTLFGSNIASGNLSISLEESGLIIYSILPVFLKLVFLGSII